MPDYQTAEERREAWMSRRDSWVRSGGDPAEFERRMAEAQRGDGDLLARLRELGVGAPAHQPSARSDALHAELGTAKTRAERRDAVSRFMAEQEQRAAGEGTGSAGGNLVPTLWNAAVIRLMRDYDGLMRDFEYWETGDGAPYTRAIAAQFSAAATQTEGNAFTDGPYPTLTQQAWGDAPTYAASYTASNQLAQDAFRTPNAIASGGGNYAETVMVPVDAGGQLTSSGASQQLAPISSVTPDQAMDAFVASVLGESLGRALAPVARDALYAAIVAQGAVSDSGGFLALAAAAPVTFAGGATTELAAQTISLDTAAQMVGAIDEAYLESDSCAWYMSRKAWQGILRQVDAQKHAQVNPSTKNRTLYGFPVVLTAQSKAAAASTVSGPVFGVMGAAMTLRVAAGSFGILRSIERFAEFNQTFYRCQLRADVKSRDSRALVGVQYAAT
jgi:hypothetical protein